VTLSLSQHLILFLVSLLLVGCVTPYIRKIAIKLNIVDYPHESHKTHSEPVPYLGGLGIILGVLVTTFAAIIGMRIYEIFGLAVTILIPAVFLGIVGLVDDIKKLLPWPRFLIQNLVGIIVSISLVSTNTLGSPTGSKFIDVALSILWIVGIANAINFFDNVDGGASGTIAISSLTLFFLAQEGNQFLIAAMSIVLAGSTLGFLFWNKPPARIYMGDAGALFVGVLFATLTLRFNPNPIDKIASFSIPLLLAAVPILDTSVAVVSRIRAGKSPFQGGRDHLSHRLLNLKFSKRKTIFTLWTLTVFFSSVAVLISHVPNNFEKLISIVALLFWFILFVFFAKQQVYNRDSDTRNFKT